MLRDNIVTTVLLPWLLFALHAQGEPGVVKMNISRRPHSSHLRKRDQQPISVTNDDSVGIYYVDASVGTPPQTVRLSIDTDTSDLWMFNSTIDGCTQCSNSKFDAASSTTFKVGPRDPFSINLANDMSVNGSYFTDAFALDESFSLSGLTMGLANARRYYTTGVMGLRPGFRESAVTNGGSEYQNILDLMVNQSVVATRAYSLYLDDINQQTRSILFGGYDTSKYYGELTMLTIQPNAKTSLRVDPIVLWSSLILTDGASSTILGSGFPYPALMTTGSYYMSVPSDLFTQLAGYFGATHSRTGDYLVDCGWNDTDKGSLAFQFGSANGPIVNVPFSELVSFDYDTDGIPITLTDGSPACLFSVRPVDEGDPIVLGETFMRSAYVLYDWDNEQIGIGDAIWGRSDGESNIVVLSNNTNSGYTSVSTISGATVTVTETATGVAGPPAKTFSGSVVTISSAATSAITGQTTTLDSAAGAAAHSATSAGSTHSDGTTSTTGGGSASATTHSAGTSMIHATEGSFGKAAACFMFGAVAAILGMGLLL